MSRSHRAALTRSSILAGGAVLVVLAVILGLHHWSDLPKPFARDPWCEATANGNTFEVTPAQMANVATIAGVGMRRRLPARAVTIALATARQESKFINVNYGDRDSLGLFQQRPSQGWGTVAQVRDPVHATNAFYDALVKVDRYQTREITEVAQRVQRSAYPQAYADHEAEGRVLASALTGHSPAALNCHLDEASAPGGTAAVQPFLAVLRREQVKVSARTLPGGAGVRLTTSDPRIAWSLANWSVGSAQRLGVAQVSVDGRQWSRRNPDAGWSPVTGQPANSVTILFTNPAAPS